MNNGEDAHREFLRIAEVTVRISAYSVCLGDTATVAIESMTSGCLRRDNPSVDENVSETMFNEVLHVVNRGG